MELVMVVLILLAFGIFASIWGYDSRPVDADRATRWFPGTPRD